MTTAKSRVQLDISAKDQTAAAFASVRRGLESLNRTANLFKGVMMAAVGGEVLGRGIRSLVEINSKVEPVRASVEALRGSWEKFALKVGDAGLNRALISFSGNMSTMLTKLDGLANAVGGGLGSTILSLGKAFEWVGRSVAFVSDNIDVLKGKITSLVPEVSGMFSASPFAMMLNPIGTTGKALDAIGNSGAGQKAIEVLKALGLETRSLTENLNSAAPKLQEMPKLFEDVANSTKGMIDPAFQRLLDQGNQWRESVMSPLETYRSKLQEIGVLLNEGVISQTTYNRALTQLQDSFAASAEAINAPAQAMKDVAQIAQGAFGSTFSTIMSGSASAAEAFKDMTRSMAQSVTQLFANRAIEMLINMLMGGGVAPSQQGGFLSNLFGGFRAGGGPVSGGKAYVVGERGRELFMPGNSGSIIPNDRLGGGSTSVVINNYSGEGVSQKQRQNADGSRTIEVMIGNIAEKRMGQSSKKFFGAGFGISPQLVQR